MVNKTGESKAIPYMVAILLGVMLLSLLATIVAESVTDTRTATDAATNYSLISTTTSNGTLVFVYAYVKRIYDEGGIN